LDRQHRLRNGAAETNLAALREREIRRARFGGEPRGGESIRVPGTEMTNLRERRRPATGDLGQRAPGLAPEIDDSEWREWPSWWPTPPPPTAAAATDTTSVRSLIPAAAAAASSSSAWPYSGRTPG
ncbi:unnamed protein product, partial [Ectocarpus sp. 12 AP-2014]